VLRATNKNDDSNFLSVNETAKTIKSHYEVVRNKSVKMITRKVFLTARAFS
jgi:hypothetical protein